MMMIRDAKEHDAARLLEIYTPYVTDAAISFETEAPSLTEFAARITSVQKQYPYIVCEMDGMVVGYAYATRHRARAAYRYSADLSIYVDQAYHRKGVGRALYGKLFELLRKRCVYTAYVGIALPNDKSMGFHKSFGFEEVGTYHNVGYKAGKWIHVMWLEKPLRAYDTP